jgi:hypothetical protein
MIGTPPAIGLKSETHGPISNESSVGIDPHPYDGRVKDRNRTARQIYEVIGRQLGTARSVIHKQVQLRFSIIPSSNLP